MMSGRPGTLELRVAIDGGRSAGMLKNLGFQKPRVRYLPRVPGGRHAVSPFSQHSAADPGGPGEFFWAYRAGFSGNAVARVANNTFYIERLIIEVLILNQNFYYHIIYLNLKFKCD